MQNGLIRTFRDDGSLLAETTYDAGRKHGPYQDYWSNGRVSCEGIYVNDIQEGEWHFYHEDGSVRELVQYQGGKEGVDWDRFFGWDSGEG